MQTASIDGLVAHQETVMQESASMAKGFLNTFKNFATNMAMVVGLQFAMWVGRKIWDNLDITIGKHRIQTKANKERIAKLAEEASNSLTENVGANSDNQKSVLAMTEDFQKLATGVSRTGENLSLTNEQYKTYRNYVEQLIELNPSLVEGINSQGDAFINNKTAIDETTKALKEQQRAMYSAFYRGEDGKNVLADYINDIDDAEAKLKEILDRTSLGSYSNFAQSQDYYRGSGANYIQKIILLTKQLPEYGYDPDQVQQIIEKYNLDINQMTSSEEGLIRAMEMLDTSSEQFLTDIKNIKNAKGSNGAELGRFEDYFTQNHDNLIALQESQDTLDSIRESLDDYVDGYAHTIQTYYDLNAQQLRLLDSYIDQYDFADKLSKSKDPNQTIRLMKNEIEFFISMFNRLRDSTNDAFSEISTLDKSVMTYDEYKEKVNMLINKIVNDPNFDEERISEKQLRIALGVDFYADDTQVENAYEAMIENLLARFESQSKISKTQRNGYDLANYTSMINRNLRGQLTPDQIERLFNADDISIFSSWEKAEEYLNKAQPFDISTYQDQIDTIIKNYNTLGEALKKVNAGELRKDIKGSTEEVMNLIKEFPELADYVDFTKDDFGDLRLGLIHLIETQPDKLYEIFDKLGDLADEDRKKILQVKAALAEMEGEALGKNISFLVSKGLTESDYLTYVTREYDKIIDQLEAEKERQESINDSLKEQKEKLEEIIDEYKIAGDTVLKALDKKIDEITDYYDEQINALKEENEELDRNIELQEKRDALANARKTKVRIYDETQGWTYTSDLQAIQKAEEELTKLENDIKIDELEKQRDKEIKLWEDYKEAWQEAMDAYTDAHNEAITEGILGSDWRNKVMDRDEDMLNSYKANYNNFQRQLDNDIDKQIAKNEQYINNIDKKIKAFESDKKAMQDWITDLEQEKLRYFDLIDDISITENSSWETRLANLKEFKTNYLRMMSEVRAANGEKMPELATEVAAYDIGKGLTSSPKVQVKYQNKVRGTYDSLEDAQKYKDSLIASEVEKYVKSKAMSGNIVTQSEIQKQRELLNALITFNTVGSYSTGGVIDKTGVALVHGTSSQAEVALNSTQARSVYDFIASGALSNAAEVMTKAYNALISVLPKPSLNGLSMPAIKLPGGVVDSAQAKQGGGSNNISISFPNAHIDATDYDSFKGFMDRYTNDLLLKMQVGL